MAWLVRAWVAVLVLPVDGDSPPLRAYRTASVGASRSESLLVGIASSAPARRVARGSRGAQPSVPRSSARSTPTAAVVVPALVAPSLPTAEPREDEGVQSVESREPPAREPAQGEGADAWPDKRCETDLWLAGSVVNMARPRRSLAMVRKPTGTAVVSLGGRVDEFTVLAIQPTRAALRALDGSECSLSEVPPGSRPEAVAAPPRVDPTGEPGDKPPPGRAMFAGGELARGVRPLGNGSYGVARQLVLKALANPGGAAGGAWFRLFERDGQRVGMEVRAVRDGTALSAMGIHTGDVARSVNGVALDTPAGLIEALRAARESDSLTISILRDGRASDMRYTIE
jgi:hypothetical protein